jgi:hypothetical protein
LELFHAGPVGWLIGSGSGSGGEYGGGGTRGYDQGQYNQGFTAGGQAQLPPSGLPQGYYPSYVHPSPLLSPPIPDVTFTIVP